jgi:hypothetical protein
MRYSVIYHPNVAIHLQAIGLAEARIVLGVMSKRIKFAEPEKPGHASHIKRSITYNTPILKIWVAL